MSVLSVRSFTVYGYLLPTTVSRALHCFTFHSCRTSSAFQTRQARLCPPLDVFLQSRPPNNSLQKLCGHLKADLYEHPGSHNLEDPLFTKKGAEGQIEHLDVEKGFGRGNLFVFCPSLSARKTPRVSKLSNMHGLLSDAESVQAQNHCGHFGYNCPVLQGQP